MKLLDDALMMMVMKKAIINECYEHALIEIKVGAAESGDKSWSIHLCITYYVCRCTV